MLQMFLTNGVNVIYRGINVNIVHVTNVNEAIKTLIRLNKKKQSLSNKY